MPKKAVIRYRSLRSHLIHLPLSLYASLVQQQARPQGLVLHLAPLVASSSRATPRSAYIGWSGLASASSLAGVGAGVEGETVEIDPEVAMDLNWPEGTIAEISVIHNPTKAKSISLTPLTSDDWEILEQHANFLENNLLSQLRAAQKGQELDVWVMGKSKIRVRVDETNPPTSSSSAVLVTPDTEVIVAPQPRRSSKKHAPESDPVIVNGHSALVGLASEKGKEKERFVELRLVPSRIASTWAERSLGQEEAAQVGSENVALCSSSIMERIRKRLKVPPGARLPHVKLKRTGEEKDADDAASNWSAKLEGSQSEHSDGPHEDVLNAEILEWDEMPDGCIAIPGDTDGGWADWVKVHVCAGEAGSRGKRKGRSRQDMRLTFGAAARQDVHLIGVEDVQRDAIDYLHRSFGSRSGRTILLVGGKGNGKTTLAKALGKALEAEKSVLAETIYEDVGRMDAEGRSEGLKAKMDAWVNDARQKQPCCLILDALDALLSPENEFTPSSVPAVLAEHFSRLVASLPQQVLIIATATSVSSLHPSLSTNHTFGLTIKLPVPDKAARQEVLQTRLNSSHSDSAQRLDFVMLAGMTEGYSFADILSLEDNASQQALIRAAKSNEVDSQSEMQDFEQAQATFTPVSLRGVSLQKSDVKWGDIGGLQKPRRLLRETLEWPTKYAQIFNNCPLRLRSGLLLYGYPGCGKTLLASAVAKECGLNFISVKGPEILNKYIGASEQAVRTLFERASAAKPCVLFFDEFDSIAPKRGHDSTGVTDRVVNQMLTEMDGAEGLEGVYVLAATSRPDLIDPALLRPGRLDKSMLCDMPNTEDRLEILESLSRKLELGESVMLDQLAAESEGFSGADLQAMLYNAHLEVVHSTLGDVPKQNPNGPLRKGKGKAKENGIGIPNGHMEESRTSRTYRQLAPSEQQINERAISEKLASLTMENPVGKDKPLVKASSTPIIEQVHLLKSLANTRPSVSHADRYRLERIYDAFANNRDGNMSNGDLGRATGTRISLK